MSVVFFSNNCPNHRAFLNIGILISAITAAYSHQDINNQTIVVPFVDISIEMK